MNPKRHLLLERCYMIESSMFLFPAYKMKGATILVSLFVAQLFVKLGRVFAAEEVSVSCTMVYDEGGASAVLRSPECPNCVLSSSSAHLNQPFSCQSATLQGRRNYQEDRIACDLHMKLPFLGENGHKNVSVSIVAIFDGHGGEEGSDMAAKLLFDYFYLHSAFKEYKYMELHVANMSLHGRVFYREILREALISTILDIDARFSEEAVQMNFFSGSTATVALVSDGQILIANVGDSKAFIYSEKVLPHPSGQGNMTRLSAIPLTKDHHPDREDEKVRIEAAGGFISTFDVPRVKGMLAMSRSIGDVPLKRYGVISVPELTGWRQINNEDQYLLVASDGIFESLTPQDIGDLIQEWSFRYPQQKGSEILSSCPSSMSLTECIVRTAYDRKSMDNLSVILMPLRTNAYSDKYKASKCILLLAGACSLIIFALCDAYTVSIS